MRAGLTSERLLGARPWAAFCGAIWEVAKLAFQPVASSNANIVRAAVTARSTSPLSTISTSDRSPRPAALFRTIAGIRSRRRWCNRAAVISVMPDSARAGLRRLAREQGVAAFGTHALMRALRERGTVSDDAFTAGVTALRGEFCTEFAKDENWLLAAAERDHWNLGPALLAMSRASTWLNPQEAFSAWRHIVTAAANDNPLKVAPWLRAGVTGIAQVVREPEPLLSLAASFLVQAAFDTG